MQPHREHPFVIPTPDCPTCGGPLRPVRDAPPSCRVHLCDRDAQAFRVDPDAPPLPSYPAPDA